MATIIAVLAVALTPGPDACTVELLVDGRVGALVETGVLGGESTVAIIIFVERNGESLIDEVTHDVHAA